MKKVLKKRTGFTLVELLIVIIIIGILAGAMLLVAGSGTDKAEATKIVSNLRSLKAAALMYYADNPSAAAPLADGAITPLEKYMDRPIEAPKAATYSFETGTISGDAGGWFVGLKGNANYPGAGVADKLFQVRTEVGLLLGTTQDADAPATDELYNKGDNVYMRAR